MAITDLPSELLVLIARNLSSANDIASCVSTCRRWYEAGAAAVYEYNDGQAIAWALENDHNRMVDRALAIGLQLFHLHHLTLAAATGRIDLAKQLLQSDSILTQWRSCNRRQREMTPLLAAAANGSIDMMQLLLDVLNVDTALLKSEGWDPISIACFYRNYDAVQLLLQPALNAGNQVGQLRGCKPLHWAVDAADPEITRLLISRFDGYFRDEHHKTEYLSRALIYAAIYGELQRDQWEGPDETLRTLCAAGVKKAATGTPDDAASCVAILLANGANIEVVERPGEYTPLHLATREGHMAIARTLINHGADIFAVVNTRLGPRTPLLFAAGHSDVQLVQDLLDSGAATETPRSVNWGCNRAIDVAAMAGQPEVIKLLLRADPTCDINKGDPNGHTALYLAAKFGSYDAVKVLIDRGASILCRSNEGYTPLHVANSPDIAKFLLDVGAPVDNTDGHKPAGKRQAARKRQERHVRQGGSPTPLLTACGGGRGSVATFLLEAGADPMAKGLNGCTTIHEAARSGLFEVIALLVSRGVSINQAADDGHTPLHAAVLSGHLNIVEQLLNLGADANARDNLGETPLYLGRNSLDVMMMLAKHGADINDRDPDGLTLLHKVVQPPYKTNTERDFENLVNLGVDLEARDNQGYSVLHTAVKCDSVPMIIEWIIERGGDINAVNNRGWTVLMTASHQDYEDAVNALVRHGANIEATVGGREGGRTALCIAARAGNDSIVQALLCHGADPMTAEGKGDVRCNGIVRWWIEDGQNEEDD